ncbi:50S ribosomal protein L10 [Candidatus Pacearchaeota archaeon]|nr:50S ribosomal protein L10 [Candidatus Pacearchaeota archaeon]
MKSKTKKTTHVSEIKKSAVKELVELMKKKSTILIASVKNLPASQFQEISKKFRGKAIIKVLKKNLVLRALEESKNEELKKIKDFVDDSTAVLFSDLDAFELAADLIQNKSPAKAKAGQTSLNDIEVEAGPTDLVPGPAISELGALGIQIQIDKGKITIKSPKIIVKKGEKISEQASSIMNKLDIKPFLVGFIPISAFDVKEKKLYREISVNREEILKELRESFAKALAFAVHLGFATSETIKILIGKTGRHGKTIENLFNKHASENKSGENEK